MFGSLAVARRRHGIVVPGLINFVAFRLSPWRNSVRRKSIPDTHPKGPLILVARSRFYLDRISHIGVRLASTRTSRHTSTRTREHGETRVTRPGEHTYRRRRRRPHIVSHTLSRALRRDAALSKGPSPSSPLACPGNNTGGIHSSHG